MAERRDRAPDDFEWRLRTQLDSGEVHFPKAVLIPPEQEVGPRGLLASWWARVAARSRLPRLLLRPAFACALVAALLVPATLGVWRLRSSPPPAPAEAPPFRGGPSDPRAALPATRLGSLKAVQLGGGQVRGDGSVTRVTVEASDDFVLLSFLAPTRSDPRVVYEATLADASGRTVAAKRPLRSTDGRGGFAL